MKLKLPGGPRPGPGHRWTCIQPGCTAEALPSGGPPPGSPFCAVHNWETYRQR